MGVTSDKATLVGGIAMWHGSCISEVSVFVEAEYCTRVSNLKEKSQTKIFIDIHQMTKLYIESVLPYYSMQRKCLFHCSSIVTIYLRKYCGIF